MHDTELVVAFHHSLYDLPAVQAAAEAYGPYCADVQLAEEGPDVLVTLKGFDPGYADMIEDAFCNHALHETIVARREAALQGMA